MTKVFISYSHDSDEHRQRVLRLSDRLREDGIDCWIDQYINGAPAEGWQRWMEQQIDSADFVLIICTQAYLQRFRGKDFNAGRGVNFEGIIISQVLYDNFQENTKFIPIISEEGSLDDVPLVLKSGSSYKLNSDYEQLYRVLTAQPLSFAKPLGRLKHFPMSETRIFISYAHRDKSFKDELLHHLASLKKSKEIVIWDDGLLIPGQVWGQEILKRLDASNIIILLISSDYLSSDYAYEVELRHAIAQSRKGKSRIIPIIVRDCDWRRTEISDFNVLPTGGRSILSSDNVDRAWFKVIENINYVIKEQQYNKNIIVGDNNVIENSNIVENKKYYDVNDVFPLNGTPKINFVEPVSFKRLVSSIRHKGRGLVIEGPSGIGKTTALKKAIEKIDIGIGGFTYLSARNPRDLKKIVDIAEYHKGIIAIDDFHRLKDDEKRLISNYLKYLADVESHNKLIIIGIPNTGKKLISFGYDLATRVDVFQLSRVENSKIEELILKGEDALNIQFEKKSELISAANGSLNVAQFLCHYSVIAQDIYETVKNTTLIDTEFVDTISYVKSVLKPKFEDFIFNFTQLGGVKDRTCIKILLALANSSNGTKNLIRISETVPELKDPISNIIRKELIENLIARRPECKSFIYYDKYTKDLVIDDPQLIFYLNYTPESILENLTGKITLLPKDKIFISYSHKDEAFADRVLVHLAPIFRDGIIDVWSDKRIKPGEKWNKEIQSALESSKIAILLVSADFLASEYINEKELPKLIKSSQEGGTVIIPVFLKPSNLHRFDNITQYQGVNTPSRTIIDMEESEQEKQFVALSLQVDEYYSKS